MGQNAEVQKRYWNALKSTKWNVGRSGMPKYSILEDILVEDPNFNDFDTLSLQIKEKTFSVIREIMKLL